MANGGTAPGYISMNDPGIPSYALPPAPSPTGTGGAGTGGWMDYIPLLSAGTTGLGALYNIFQLAQRSKQMSALRKLYGGDAWRAAAQRDLSRLVGDAASRGLSGSPNYLAGLVSSAYAPWQLEFAKAYQSATTPAPGIVNPFDSFLKSLQALKDIRGVDTRPSATGVNYNLNATRGGSLDAISSSPTPPLFSMPEPEYSMIP